MNQAEAFERAVTFLLSVEDPDGTGKITEDSGGLTKYGISQRCLDPNVRVLRSDLSWIAIGNVNLGDELLAFDEIPSRHGKLNLRCFRRARVTKIGPVRLPASRIITDRQTLTAGDDHLWLRRWGQHRLFEWCVTSNLLKSRKRWTTGVTVRMANTVRPWTAEHSYEAGYLAAMLDGEGHVSHGTVGFTQKDNEAAEKALHCASVLGLSFIRRHPRHGVWSFDLENPQENGFYYLSILGRLGAVRLLANVAKQLPGKSVAPAIANHEIVLGVESLGPRELIGIETTTGTIIAEGLLSHNSYPDLDIRALTREGAVGIYERDYWQHCKCGDLPPGLGLLVFDSAVNQGQPTACRMLQRALGVKPVDGIIGPQTIAAANVDPLKTILEYGALRANSYAQTVGVPQSGLGWFRRLFRAFNMAVNLPR